ncbi:hypothetical protein W97_01194 [Coniosporium apollinis CBS 100218]|uniref:Fungal N-terminal domain-containing protein n=1 Tax=Coniosporium apollinis (strain CBS 100218) TaxID=1168221 RepID=R7YK11_CONA1|nr:uncharacterized protein W97_01194 [Coniosporium apollinis CBS 100218]EON61976.1 hypothetical protein W97_01194 [Coniosporium apollinis CBS 100218]
MLYEFTSSMEDAPRLARDVLTELSALTVSLGHMQTYVLGAAQVSPARASLILLKHMLVTLTGCVTTYSELETVMKGLSVGSSKVYVRLRWTMREKYIPDILWRLQMHKSSLALMLNIIQCNSMSEAERQSDNLCDLINQVLRSNEAMLLRLRNLEERDNHLSQSEATDQQLRSKEPSYRLATPIHDREQEDEETDDTVASSAPRFTFEDDLSELWGLQENPSK